jgi:hypothetical protein
MVAALAAIWRPRRWVWTAFVPRPKEQGPHQTKDVKPAQAWDVVADSFLDLATRLGC